MAGGIAMKERTQKEKRSKIAECCGWIYNGEKTTAPSGEVFFGEYVVPDYFKDLNACREMEKALEWDQRKQYHSVLADIAGFSYCEADTQEETSLDWNCRICHAEAAHRAEAFGKTMNLW